jgi:hypothetical protein
MFKHRPTRSFLESYRDFFADAREEALQATGLQHASHPGHEKNGLRLH